MKVVLTETLNLEVVNLPFEFYFASTYKNKADHDYNHWFTPTGKCRIYFGGCHIQELGNYNEKDEARMVQAMMSNKCDILTDGRDYYTRCTGFVGKILNMSTIIYQANAEWQARKTDEGWENKKTYVEGERSLPI